MSDITEKVAPAKAQYALHGFGDPVVYRLNFAQLEALAAGDYTVVNIPVGKVPLGGYLVVTKDAASAGAATVAVKIGTVTVVSALAKTVLTAGKVIPVGPLVAGTVGGALSGDTATPVVITVSTADLTDFECLLVLTTADIAAVN